MPAQFAVGDLLKTEPETWGLRGDPYLWAAMRDALAATPLPRTASEFIRMIEETFLELTGQALVPGNFFILEQFAHGGMSSGGIDPQFWYEQALPLLFGRYLSATSVKR